MNGEPRETMGRWKTGDKVWYKDKSSLETAWDQPVLMTVVLENDGMVWVKDELEDKLVFSNELTPYTKEDEEKKATLATLYALLKQTSLNREEVGEVCSVLVGAGITFDKEEIWENFMEGFDKEEKNDEIG